MTKIEKRSMRTNRKEKKSKQNVKKTRHDSISRYSFEQRTNKDASSRWNDTNKKVLIPTQSQSSSRRICRSKIHLISKAKIWLIRTPTPNESCIHTHTHIRKSVFNSLSVCLFSSSSFPDFFHLNFAAW